MTGVESFLKSEVRAILWKRPFRHVAQEIIFQNLQSIEEIENSRTFVLFHGYGLLNDAKVFYNIKIKNGKDI